MLRKLVWNQKKLKYSKITKIVNEDLYRTIDARNEYYMTEEFERYNDYFLKNNFPVELRNTSKMGRGLFATQDIKQGEKILSADIYNFSINYKERKIVCEHCLGPIEKSSISCGSCNDEVFYCSKKCKREHKQLHQFECEYFSKIENFLKEELKNSDSMFGKKLHFDRLMTELKFHLKLISKSVAEESLKKWFPIGGAPREDSLDLSFKEDYLRLFSARKIIEDLEKKEQMVKLQEIIQNFTNHKFSREEIIDMIAKDACTSFEMENGYGTAPVINFINHSCSPNSEYWFRNGRYHLFPVHDIPKDTELKVSYISISPPSKRRKLTLKNFFVSCECSDEQKYCNKEYMNEYACPDCEKEITFKLDPESERFCKECHKNEIFSL
jgi:hypothetical protein